MFELHIKKIVSRNIFKLGIACLTLAILNGYFFNWVNDNFLHYQITNHLEETSKAKHFFIAVIFAPIIESYLLQYFPNVILNKLKVQNKFSLIVLPSILFGLLHTYHWLYMVMTFFSGLILNFYYIECKQLSKYAFWLLALLHALYNLYGFLFVS